MIVHLLEKLLINEIADEASIYLVRTGLGKPRPPAAEQARSPCRALPALGRLARPHRLGGAAE